MDAAVVLLYPARRAATLGAPVRFTGAPAAVETQLPRSGASIPCSQRAFYLGRVSLPVATQAGSTQHLTRTAPTSTRYRRCSAGSAAGPGVTLLFRRSPSPHSDPLAVTQTPGNTGLRQRGRFISHAKNIHVSMVAGDEAAAASRR